MHREEVDWKYFNLMILLGGCLELITVHWVIKDQNTQNSTRQKFNEQRKQFSPRPHSKQFCAERKRRKTRWKIGFEIRFHVCRYTKAILHELYQLGTDDLCGSREILEYSFPINFISFDYQWHQLIWSNTFEMILQYPSGISGK